MEYALPGSECALTWSFSSSVSSSLHLVFLSVPLPIPTTRDLSVIVVQSGFGISSPRVWPLRISKGGITINELKGEVRDIMNAAPQSANLLPTKVTTATLIATEVYQHKIFKVLAADFSTSRIGKQDVIVFFHVPETEHNADKGQERQQKHCVCARARVHLKSYCYSVAE